LLDGAAARGVFALDGLLVAGLAAVGAAATGLEAARRLAAGLGAAGGAAGRRGRGCGDDAPAAVLARSSSRTAPAAA
jgi:hypothetical protein